MKSIPNDSQDPEWLRHFQEYRQSPLYAFERELAQLGDCPHPRELEDLQEGRITQQDAREALAAHLLHCPRCADENLSALLRRDAEAIATLPSRRPIRLRHLVAAAALLFATYVGSRPAHLQGKGGIDEVFFTNEVGLELRSVHELERGESRRLLVVPSSDGYVSMARLRSDSIGLVPIDQGALVTHVDKGRELLLPLDRALEVNVAEDWMVIFTAARPTVAQLDAWVQPLTRGKQIDGVETRRVALRPVD